MVKKRSYIIWILIPLLNMLSGCKTLCRVEIPDLNATKHSWFSQELKIDGISAWNRVENYSGKSIYLETIDTEILVNCGECEKIQNDLNIFHNTAQSNVFMKQCKSLKITSKRDFAEYIGYLKIASVHEVSVLAKYPGPLGASSNISKFWFKIVNAKTNKVIFGYSSIGSIESQYDFDSSMRLLIRTIDDFNKNGSS